MNRYEVLSCVGEGAYGVVLKCRNKENGELVAIKKFRESDEDEVVRKTTLREVKMLRSLRQSNIVELKEAFRRKGKLYLVFEFVEKTLLEVLESRRKGLDPAEVRQYIYQLVKAVSWCHQHNIAHRDIKPENLLISPGPPGSTVGQLKLCDFGFARQLPANVADESITDYVSTRWYRAPDLLLGSSHYGKEVDVWAIGCIMAELTDGQPLFPGDSDIDQLYVVQKMLGPLCRAHDILFLKNSRFACLKFPDMSRPLTLDAKYGHSMSPDALDFLKGTLAMDPSKRLTCAQCLAHPYLADLTQKDSAPLKDSTHKRLAAAPPPAAAAAAIPAAAAAAAAAAASCHSNASSATHLTAGAAAASGGSSSTAESSPFLVLPPAVSSNSLLMRQPQQPLVPHQVTKQQPALTGAVAAGGKGQQPTPRLTLSPDMIGGAGGSGVGSGTASRQPHAPNTSKQATPRMPQPAAVGTRKPAVVAKHKAGTDALTSTAAIPRLHLGSTRGSNDSKRGGAPGQLHLEVTPRTSGGVAAVAGRGAAKAGAAAAAAVAGAVSTSSAAALAAAAAAATDPGDQDMPDADGQLTARRKKRLASGSLLSGTSLRAAGVEDRRRRDMEDVHAAATGPSMPPAPAAAGGGGVLQPAHGQQQQRLAGTSLVAGLGSRMDVDGLNWQQLGQQQSPGQLPPVGGTPLWWEAGRDAAAPASGSNTAADVYGSSPGGTSGSGQYRASCNWAVKPSGSLNTTLPGRSSGSCACPLSGDDGGSCRAASPGQGAVVMGTRNSLASSLGNLDDVLSGLHAAGPAGGGMGVGPAGANSSFTSYYSKGGAGQSNSGMLGAVGGHGMAVSGYGLQQHHY